MSAFWTRVRDSLGNVATIDTPGALADWLALTPQDYAIEIMLGGEQVGSVQSFADDEGSFIDALTTAELTGSMRGQVLRHTYTRGDCDVFAVALQRIIGGDLIAVTTPLDERGCRNRLHFLVHAGVEIGSQTYDIDGAHKTDDWSMTWRENGNCILEGDTVSITKRRLQSLQKTVHTKLEIETAMRIAWFVAALTGMLDDRRLADYRALHQPLKKAA